MADQTARGIDLVAAATEDFKANLRFPRARALLVDYYTKLGLTSAELREAIRGATAAGSASIRIELPETVAA